MKVEIYLNRLETINKKESKKAAKFKSIKAAKKQFKTSKN